MFGFKKKEPEPNHDWTDYSCLSRLYRVPPEELAKREKEEAEKEMKLLKLNERDEHDGKARRAGDYYVRTAGVGWSLADGLGIRARGEVEPVVFTEDMVPALKEATKWFGEIKRKREERAKEEEDE